MAGDGLVMDADGEVCEGGLLLELVEARQGGSLVVITMVRFDRVARW